MEAEVTFTFSAETVIVKKTDTSKIFKKINLSPYVVL